MRDNQRSSEVRTEGLLETSCWLRNGEGFLAKGRDTMAGGEGTAALLCAYRASLQADAAGDAAALVGVGDLLLTLGLPRDVKVNVLCAYLRAAEHARRAEQWHVVTAVASRLFALGELEDAGALALIADLCSQRTAPDPQVPCDPE